MFVSEVMVEMVKKKKKERSKVMKIKDNFFFFFYLRGVSELVYAHHDYSPRPTGHPASPEAGKAPRG